MNDPSLFYVFWFPAVFLGVGLIAESELKERKKDSQPKKRTFFGKEWPVPGWSRWKNGVVAFACLVPFLALLWACMKGFALGYALACGLIVIFSLREFLKEEDLSTTTLFLALSVYWFSIDFLWARIIMGGLLAFFLLYSFLKKKNSMTIRACWVLLFIANALSADVAP